jgi:hypothetical protein
MPGRKYIQAGASPYRYSINGQEKDLELNENITTAEYWEYDSRIGRRWNVDPVPDESQSPYATFDNNPISITDVNGDCTTCPGDPIESKYLGWTGLNFGSFGNGIADGLLGASPIGAAKFAWEMFTDEDARQDFSDGMRSLISDPIGTLKAIAGDKYESWKNVLAGTGTEQQNYNVGNDVGTLVGTLLTGAGAKKVFEAIKVAKAEKLLAQASRTSEEATAINKVGQEVVKDSKTLLKEGRSGKQARLKSLVKDDKVGSAVKDLLSAFLLKSDLQKNLAVAK